MKTPTSELIEKYWKELEWHTENMHPHNSNTLLISIVITDLEQADNEWREKHREDVMEAFESGEKNWAEALHSPNYIVSKQYYNQKFGEDENN